MEKVTSIDDLAVRLENTDEDPLKVSMEFIADYLDSGLDVNDLEKAMFAQTIREYMEKYKAV